MKSECGHMFTVGEGVRSNVSDNNGRESRMDRGREEGGRDDMETILVRFDKGAIWWSVCASSTIMPSGGRFG